MLKPSAAILQLSCVSCAARRKRRYLSVSKQ